jgi:hypothetical protein
MRKLRFNILTDVLLIVLLVGGGFLLLRPYSPQQVEGAFFGVKIVGDAGLRYQLIGDEFGCAPVEGLPLDVSCQMMFEGQSLSVRLRYQDEDHRFLSFCAVTYGGAAVDCEPAFSYESPLPFVLIGDDLGLSDERIAELKAERPLLNWPESTWISNMVVVAFVLALLIAVWRWFRFRTELIKQPMPLNILWMLACGLVAFVVSVIGGNMLLGSISSSPNIAYQLIPIAALVGAGLVMYWQWRIQGGWRPKFGRLAYSLAGGTVVLTLTYFFGFMALLVLGFVD